MRTWPRFRRIIVAIVAVEMFLLLLLVAGIRMGSHG